MKTKIYAAPAVKGLSHANGAHLSAIWENTAQCPVK